jgi:hypothetical protein
MCSSCPADAGLLDVAGSTGIGALSSTRPCLTSTTRRSVAWHMVLDARDSVSLNVHQDHQLAAARSTKHCLHSD